MTPTTFYNYTPHTITLNNGTSYGSVGVARVSNSFTDFDSDGVCLKADIRPQKKMLKVSTSNQLSQARFTRRRQHAELIAKRINYQKACDSVGCLLFLVNDQAGFAIFDAMDRLKRSPLYKQKVKQLANKASKAYDLYEKTRRSMFLNKDVEGLNYILQDKYQDWLQKHVNMLRFAAYNVLTRLQVPEREAISYAIAAYGVLYLAETTFDMQFEAQRIQYGVDVRKEYAFASMHGIKRTWNDLLAYLVPEDGTRAVSDDHDFRLAMEILTKKASDVDVLNDIAGEVIVENKEKLLANANSDEVREYIEKLQEQ